MAALRRGVWTAECQVEARRRVELELIALTACSTGGFGPILSRYRGKKAVRSTSNGTLATGGPRGLEKHSRPTLNECLYSHDPARDGFTTNKHTLVWRRMGLDGKVLLLGRVNHTDGTTNQSPGFEPFPAFIKYSISRTFRLHYYKKKKKKLYSYMSVTVHTGIQERGDEDVTNRVFNGWRTEETQGRTSKQVWHMTFTITHR